MRIKTKLAATVISILLASGALIGCNNGGGEPTPPKPTLYKVIAPTSQDFTIGGLEADGYEQGKTVNFTVTVTNPDDKEINHVKFAVGESSFDCTKGTVAGAYSFVMPEAEVTLSVSLKNTAKYALSYEGEAKDGLSASFLLSKGTSPVVSYTIEGKTDADKAKVEIDRKEVTFLAVGEVTIVAKVDNKVVAELLVNVAASEHGETPRDPLSVEEAVAICDELTPSTQDKKNPSEKTYYVKGVVSKVTENKSDFANATLILEDNFTVYRASFVPGFDRNLIDVGSEVIVKSQLLLFGSTRETHTGAQFISIDNSVARYIEVDAARSVKVGTDLQLEATLKPTGSTGTVEWEAVNSEIATVSETGLVHGVAKGETKVKAKFGTSIIKEVKIFVVEEDVIGETIETALTGKQAAELAGKLESSTKDDKKPSEISYYIKGVVTELIENNPSFANATVMLEGGFEIYRAAFMDGVDRNKIVKGAEVIVKSQLLKFGSTLETHDGAIFYGADNSVPRLIEVDAVRSVQIGHSLTISPVILPVEPATGSISIVAEDPTIVDIYKGVATGLKKGTTTLTITCGELEATMKIIVTDQEVHGETAEDPLDVAKANAICAELQSSTKDNKYPSEIVYYVKGVVSEVTENDTQYENATVELDGGFTVYRAGFDEGVDRNQIVEGAVVVAKAKLLNFGGTHETYDGALFHSVDVSKATGVKIEDKVMRIQTNKSEQLKASVLPATLEAALTYEIVDDTVVSVSDEGLVTGLKEGNTVVTVKYGDFAKEVTVYVTDAEPVWPAGDHASNPFTVDQAIEKAAEFNAASPDEYYIKGEVKAVDSAYDKGVFSAQLKGSDNKIFKLYSLPASEELGAKIKVGVTLLVKCRIYNYQGTTPENGGKCTGVLEVITPELTGITLNKETAKVAVEKSIVLSAEAVPAGAELGKVEWETSDATKATVTDGLVTGVGEGEVTITAKVGQLTATCTVTVLAKGTVSEQSVTLAASTEGYTNAQAVANWSDGDVKITFAKETGSSNPAYYTTGAAIRVYAKGTLKVEGLNGAKIKSITFTFGTDDAGESANALAADHGTYTAPNWDGGENGVDDVTFTVGGSTGHRRFATIVITYLA